MVKVNEKRERERERERSEGKERYIMKKNE